MRAINRNKIIAVMAAIVVFMVSMCTYSAEANATNMSRTYKVYNAQTGDHLRQYTLSALSDYDNSGNARYIIGEDDRYVDWSKSGVVKIMSDTDFWGTGFVIDAHTIATAAHCVYSAPSIYYSRKSFKLDSILLFDNEGNVEMVATPVEYHIPYNYYYESGNYHYSQFDYALITVEEDLSDYIQFNLGAMLDTVAEDPFDVTTTGFPVLVEKTINGQIVEVTVNDHDNHNKYTSTDIIDSVDDYNLYYKNDVTSGNSGGPVYITETRGSYTYQTVIGIVTQNGNPNKGMRITTDLLHFYRNNPNLIYETEE